MLKQENIIKSPQTLKKRERLVILRVLEMPMTAHSLIKICLFVLLCLHNSLKNRAIEPSDWELIIAVKVQSLMKVATIRPFF